MNKEPEPAATSICFSTAVPENVVVPVVLQLGTNIVGAIVPVTEIEPEPDVISVCFSIPDPTNVKRPVPSAGLKVTLVDA